MSLKSKTIFLKAEAFMMRRSAEKARGSEYVKVFDRFVKIWIKRFEAQVETYIAYVDDNPQMFVEIRKEDEYGFDEELTDEIFAAYSLGLTAGEIDIQEQLTIGLSMDIVNEDSVKWAQQRVGELIKGVDETTQKEIQAIIESALTEGKSMKDIKEEIYAKFLQYTEYRANLIAVMEMGNAFEQGKKAQFGRYQNHFGIVGYKRSFTQGDSNVRPEHTTNARAGWIRANELFPGTLTDTAPHGFNCRCNVQYSLYDPSSEKPQFI